MLPYRLQLMSLDQAWAFPKNLSPSPKKVLQLSPVGPIPSSNNQGPICSY